MINIKIYGNQQQLETVKADDTNYSLVEFRLLNRTDTVHVDDEFLMADCQTWARVGDKAAKYIIGKPYSPEFFQPMRRKEYQ
jgi:hypothetical protein